mgnify:CR=1 FL=1
MRIIKKQTNKYEVSLRNKGNGYIARLSIRLGSIPSKRIEASGTTEEAALTNLLDKTILYINSNALIVNCKIDDRICQRLVSSINNYQITSSKIIEKSLLIVNMINSINSRIQNSISLQQSIIPSYIPYSPPQFAVAPTIDITSSNIEIPKPILITDIVQQWFNYRMSLCEKSPDNPKPQSQGTLDHYYDRLQDTILPFLKRNKILYLSQITPDLVRSLIKSINSQHTKCKSYIILNMIFKYAIKQKIVTCNPLESVNKPPESIKTGEEIDDNYIEPENQQIYLDAFEQENTDMSLLFKTMLLTGLRPEEACGLKWTALDLEYDELVINNAYKSFKLYNDDYTKVIGHYRSDAKLKTPQSYRRIPLSEDLKNMLLKHRQIQQELFKKSRAIKSHHRKWSEKEYIFIGRNYVPYVSDSLSYGMRKICNKYSLKKVSPYGLRRSFATLCAEKGIDKLVLMKLMGHSDYQTTVQYYIKVTSKQKKQAIKNIYEQAS